jgi:lysophospholipase L1-like esterase
LVRLALVNGLVLMLLLLLVEAGARILAPRDLRGVFNDPRVFIRQRPFVESHPTRGFALVPGYSQGEYRVNSAGFRGPELPADLSSRDLVLALGESSTFGWNVGEGETYPAQLQMVLDGRHLERTPYVINAGVPSYTSAQVLAYLRELLGLYEPHDVVIGVLWNDALFACIPNWMPDYLAAQKPGRWKQMLLRHSGLYRALVMEPPGTVQSGPVENEPALRFYAENLAAMAQACREAHARVYFLRPSVDPAHLPPEGMKIWRRVVPPDAFLALLDRFTERLETVATREHVPVVRHRLCRADSTQSRYFIDPVHLEGEGNRIVAEDVAAAVLSAATGRQ